MDKSTGTTEKRSSFLKGERASLARGDTPLVKTRSILHIYLHAQTAKSLHLNVSENGSFFICSSDNGMALCFQRSAL